MGFVCDSCGERRSGTAIKSVTGRDLCQRCSDRLLGAAAGVIEAGGFSAPDATANAISTAGWFERVKKALRRNTDQPE